jgi:hypothetical protein
MTGQMFYWRDRALKAEGYLWTCLAVLAVQVIILFL